MSGQLEQAYAELGAWSSPLDFQRKVDALNAQVKSCDYFRKHQFKLLREAWILAEFARLVDAESVCLGLVESSPADGYVKIAGDCREVQITEAERRGRRRGDEYKCPDYTVATCEPINDADDVAEALAKVIEKKLERYGSALSEHATGPTLVVYQNLGVHGRHEEEIKLQFLVAALKKKYAPYFGGIYILESGKLV